MGPWVLRNSTSLALATLSPSSPCCLQDGEENINEVTRATCPVSRAEKDAACVMRVIYVLT